MNLAYFDSVPTDVYDDSESNALSVGIYRIALNFLAQIVFVPEFDRNAQNWPPSKPILEERRFDIPSVRLVAVCTGQYIVTPDALRYNQVEIIPNPFRDEGDFYRPISIFYVPPDEFSSYSQELAVLEATELTEEQTRSMPRGGIFSARWRFKDVKHLSVFQFLLREVLTSEYFDAKDLKRLREGHK